VCAEFRFQAASNQTVFRLPARYRRAARPYRDPACERAKGIKVRELFMMTALFISITERPLST
jgi:hypothetical protein